MGILSLNSRIHTWDVTTFQQVCINPILCTSSFTYNSTRVDYISVIFVIAYGFSCHTFFVHLTNLIIFRKNLRSYLILERQFVWHMTQLSRFMLSDLSLMLHLWTEIWNLYSTLSPSKRATVSKVSIIFMFKKSITFFLLKSFLPRSADGDVPIKPLVFQDSYKNFLLLINLYQTNLYRLLSWICGFLSR